MTIKSANPNTLRTILASAQPGDTIRLEPGLYEGSYGTPTAGNPERPITVAGGPEVVFTGAKDTPLAWTVNAPYWRLQDFSIEPTAPAKSGQKPTWIAVRSAGAGAALACLTLGRDGDIEKSKAWNDYGMVIEADATTVHECRLYGMTKPIHVKGRNRGVTITRNHIGPSYQSSIVMGTSFGVNRACLIAYNILEESYIEDGVQFMQDLGAADPETDVSNIGTIICRNTFRRMNENAIDLKGAGQIVIDSNLIEHTAGSNDGPLAGWNHNSNATIGKGARTSSGLVIVRRNYIYDNCSGVRSQPQWRIVHNAITDNNWYPVADAGHTGYGVTNQNGGQGLAILNNLIHGHEAGDLVRIPASAHVAGNQHLPGPPYAAAEPLTITRTAGEGVTIPVGDAGFWSAWFGRTDLPPESISVGDSHALVVAVDYAARAVTIDRPLQWLAGAPVGYRADATVGIVRFWEDAPPVEPEPPIVVVPPDPPTVEPEPEPVTESVTLTGPPAAVAMLRALVKSLGDLSIED